VQKLSVDHHYLSQHYLKGFTDEQGAFFVYDKKADKVLPPTNPRSTFFEKHLNTVTFPNGDVSDFLEKLYSAFEGQVWSSFDTIRASTHSTKIDPRDLRNLFLFLLIQHWRLPRNCAYAETFAADAFCEESDLFNFFTLERKDGGKVPDKVLDDFRKFEPGQERNAPPCTIRSVHEG
jgi:Protein of unknown function (DUF4238)